MAEELNVGEKLNRELAAKPGHEDLLRLEQRLGGRMEGLEGRMDEISRQLAAKR